MKFRLDVQHYAEDKLLDAGTEVGDGCSVSWRDAKGHALTPSKGMTPLDDEAKVLFKKTFPGESRPDIDPTKAIPVMGNVKQSAPLHPANKPPVPATPVPLGSPLTKE